MVFTAARALSATLFLTFSLTTSSVWAHAHLQQQTPAANGDVSSSPDALVLRFSEGIESRFSGVTLTDANGKTVETGTAVRHEGDNTQLDVPIKQPLAAGLYHVNWHVVSVDGHKTKGQYQFRVK